MAQVFLQVSIFRMKIVFFFNIFLSSQHSSFKKKKIGLDRKQKFIIFPFTVRQGVKVIKEVEILCS